MLHAQLHCCPFLWCKLTGSHVWRLVELKSCSSAVGVFSLVTACSGSFELKEPFPNNKTEQGYTFFHFFAERFTCDFGLVQRSNVWIIMLGGQDKPDLCFFWFPWWESTWPFTFPLYENYRHFKRLLELHLDETDFSSSQWKILWKNDYKNAHMRLLQTSVLRCAKLLAFRCSPVDDLCSLYTAYEFWTWHVIFSDLDKIKPRVNYNQVLSFFTFNVSGIKAYFQVESENLIRKLVSKDLK